MNLQCYRCWTRVSELHEEVQMVQVAALTVAQQFVTVQTFDQMGCSIREGEASCSDCTAPILHDASIRLAPTPSSMP